MKVVGLLFALNIVPIINGQLVHPVSVGGYYRVLNNLGDNISDVFAWKPCQDLCLDNDECESWIWRNANHETLPNTCRLARVTNDFVEDTAQVKHVSCPQRECRFPPISVGGYYHVVTDLDNNLSDVFAWKHCQDLCLDNDECDSWIWRNANHETLPNTCRLARVTNDFVHVEDTAQVKHVSCPQKECRFPPVSVGGYYVAGANSIGDNIFDIFAWQPCQDLCLEDDECQSWIWRNGNHETLPNTCRLSREAGDFVDVEDTAQVLHISCPNKECRATAHVYPNCDVEHTDWLGDGFCDDAGNYNLLECGWDLGDCCEYTCLDATFPCGESGFDCRDPTINIQVTPVGPLGGFGGNPFDDLIFYRGQRVAAINVEYATSLNKIQVVYDAEPQPPVHGDLNATFATFDVPVGTHISEVCVSVVPSGQYITSIQFRLSNGVRSPLYGTQASPPDCRFINKRLAYISGRADYIVDQLTFWETAVPSL